MHRNSSETVRREEGGGEGREVGFGRSQASERVTVEWGGGRQAGSMRTTDCWMVRVRGPFSRIIRYNGRRGRKNISKEQQQLAFSSPR